MRHTSLIIFIVIFVNGCGQKNKVPADVLAPAKMQAVLWDLMRADQFISDYVVNKDTTADRFSKSVSYYKKIFSIHSITKEKFQRSFNYYQSHPYLLKNIMDSLSKEPAIEMLEKSLNDSILPTDSPKIIIKDTVTTFFKKRKSKTLI